MTDPTPRDRLIAAARTAARICSCDVCRRAEKYCANCTHFDCAICEGTEIKQLCHAQQALHLAIMRDESDSAAVEAAVKESEAAK